MKTVEQILEAKLSPQRKKHYMLIVLEYPEDKIVAQRDELKRKVKIHKKRLSFEHNQEILEELKYLRKQLSGLNYLLK